MMAAIPIVPPGIVAVLREPGRATVARSSAEAASALRRKMTAANAWSPRELYRTLETPMPTAGAMAMPPSTPPSAPLDA